jgi:hypothetical protein
MLLLHQGEPLMTKIANAIEGIATASTLPTKHQQIIGLVTVLCRSPISLCHLCFERQRADATQI